MQTEKQVAIIGAGRMGRQRLQACLQLGAQIRFVCDTDAAAAQTAATTAKGSRAITHIDQLEWEGLDAVFVCTPPASRGTVELRAIQHHVHFFVEKPVGVNANQATAVLGALGAWPAITAVGYMNRYRTSVQRARRGLRDERVLGVSAYWLCGTYGVPWWADPDQSGGPLNEQATHVIDLCRYLVDEITEVSALATGDTKAPTGAAINLRFAQGTIGTILYSCEAREKLIRFHALTENRTWQLDDWDFKLPGDPSDEDRNAIFVKEVDAFLHDLDRTEPPRVQSSFADAYRTQLVADAVRGSLQTGRSVSIA
jgi:predicted dehydrogenase